MVELQPSKLAARVRLPSPALSLSLFLFFLVESVLSALSKPAEGRRQRIRIGPRQVRIHVSPCDAHADASYSASQPSRSSRDARGGPGAAWQRMFEHRRLPADRNPSEVSADHSGGRTYVRVTWGSVSALRDGEGVRYVVHFGEGGSGLRWYDEPLQKAGTLAENGVEYIVSRVDPPRSPDSLGYAWAQLA